MPVTFLVKSVFSLRERGVILVSGQLRRGSIAGPTMLHEERTGLPVTVLGIELVPPPPKDPDLVTLILDPSSGTRLVPGTVLIGVT